MCSTNRTRFSPRFHVEHNETASDEEIGKAFMEWWEHFELNTTRITKEEYSAAWSALARPLLCVEIAVVFFLAMRIDLLGMVRRALWPKVQKSIMSKVLLDRLKWLWEQELGDQMLVLLWCLASCVLPFVVCVVPYVAAWMWSSMEVCSSHQVARDDSLRALDQLLRHRLLPSTSLARDILIRAGTTCPYDISFALHALLGREISSFLLGASGLITSLRRSSLLKLAVIPAAKMVSPYIRKHWSEREQQRKERADREENRFSGTVSKASTI